MAIRWIRIRSPKVVRAQKADHRRTVRAFGMDIRRMPTESPKARAKYGPLFPPAVAARQAARRTPYFEERVFDRHAGRFRDAMFGRKVRRRRAS